MFDINPRSPMYDQDAIQPMRDELVAVGFEELLSAEAVDSAIKNMKLLKICEKSYLSSGVPTVSDALEIIIGIGKISGRFFCFNVKLNVSKVRG